ncbi:UDP-N-acetylmuramate--L-alanine ligase [Patescibacteria group bacterium]|nr:UDP-N-acetylmuramate--L-alanine ligase [Patescibacteria group bacterium]
MKIKKIHFVGIKGVGMTPLAIIAKEAGFKVSGSDIADIFITDESLAKAEIKPMVGFNKKNVIGADLVITTGAHGGYKNIEVEEAKRMKVPVWAQGQAVGKYMDGEIFGKKIEGISIAGSHGKTTTTGILATIFTNANVDPSYLIGTSKLPTLSSCGHFGKGNFFIAEADEYATEPVFDKTSKFLWQAPKIAVFTNIEMDHPDLFASEDEVIAAFIAFTKKIKKDGVLIGCGDDPAVFKILEKYDGKKISYGFSPKNDFVISSVRIEYPNTFFWIKRSGVNFGRFSIGVPGEHNALNATAALIVSMESGISIEKIKKGLADFKGSKRRFEFIGKTKYGALVFDDYAHHPTEIRKTLKAIRESFKGKKIVCIFQPHTYSRTKKLFEQFIDSFYNSDMVIITDIYPSLRELPDLEVSSEKLVKEIFKKHPDVKLLPSLDDVVEYIDQKRLDDNFIVVTLGAGDIYKAAEKMI